MKIDLLITLQLIFHRAHRVEKIVVNREDIGISFEIIRLLNSKIYFPWGITRRNLTWRGHTRERQFDGPDYPCNLFTYLPQIVVLIRNVLVLFSSGLSFSSGSGSSSALSVFSPHRTYSYSYTYSRSTNLSWEIKMRPRDRPVLAAALLYSTATASTSTCLYIDL